ncbi:MAG: Lipopolysaccharide biosynthesis protein [Rhodoglobus sp.]|nr:Lipopolysaccharide biosynthesis protein [Rhodoglobus sp.]
MTTPLPDASGAAPLVTVLLATWNGLAWLPQQLDSILAQEGVALRVVALDDESTDGTREWLLERATSDDRLSVLPSMGSSGGSAANFYRLIRLVVPNLEGYLAFSDQDDVWHPGKLERHVGILRAGGHDAVSSSVTAFTPSGRRTLVRKDFPQREFDYLTESPGPGSTFVLSPRLALLVAGELDDPRSPASKAEFHDSLIYAIARGRGWSWHIDGEPSLDYRQHDSNVLGSNVGAASALSRLKLIRERWHRNEAVLHARVAIGLAEGERRAALEQMLALFESRGIRNRLRLARRAGTMRRRPRDQWIIGLLIAIGIW